MPTIVIDPPILQLDPLAWPVPGVPAGEAQCHLHVGLSPDAVLNLVKAHCREFRAAGPMTAWTGQPDPYEADDAGAPASYPVLGWASTSLLRDALSQRLDAMGPVAAFRLLERPEIAQLERSHWDYVVLRDADRTRNRRYLAGAVSVRDIDLWSSRDDPELGDAFAVDLYTYWHRFAGTGVAA